MLRTRIIIAGIYSLLPFFAKGQTTLEQWIAVAQKESYGAAYSEKEFELAKIYYKQFKLTANPVLSFNGNVPVFNKDNYGITQPDGTIKFLRRSQNYSNAGFSIAQPLPFTGGTVSLNTELYRFDDLTNRTMQYNGTPVFVQWQQPLFAHNTFKWNKLIEPLKLEEAKRNLQLQKNQLSYDICKAFFDVAEAQCNKQLAATNLENCILNLAQEKRKMQTGASTEYNVLQLEIQELNTLREAAAAQLSIDKARLYLQLVVNSPDISRLEIQLPDNLPIVNLDKKQLLTDAKKQLPLYINFQKNILEAKSNTARVKAQNNLVNLTASYGLTNTANSIPGIYQNPNDQQRFSIGFAIPLITWGKNKNSIAAARLQEKQAELNNKAEEARWLTEITSLINELPALQKNVTAARRIDTLTQRKFVITNRLFQSGKASLLELQAAQAEKDNARRNYIQALRQFWENWYLLKIKTNSE